MGPMARLLALPVYAYRYTFSPYVGHVCRHQPTCSVYALESLATHGAFRGFFFSRQAGMAMPSLGQLGL